MKTVFIKRPQIIFVPVSGIKNGTVIGILNHARKITIYHMAFGNMDSFLNFSIKLKRSNSGYFENSNGCMGTSTVTQTFLSSLFELEHQNLKFPHGNMQTRNEFICCRPTSVKDATRPVCSLCVKLRATERADSGENHTDINLWTN